MPVEMSECYEAVTVTASGSKSGCASEEALSDAEFELLMMPIRSGSFVCEGMCNHDAAGHVIVWLAIRLFFCR
jgi:hypothetical protein